jgi:hypothetical protein
MRKFHKICPHHDKADIQLINQSINQSINHREENTRQNLDNKINVIFATRDFRYTSLYF